MPLTPMEVAVLKSFGFPPDARWERSFAPRELSPTALAKMRADHQPAPHYGGVKTSPRCRNCRQSWRCDATRLLDTIGIPQFGEVDRPDWLKEREGIPNG